MINSLMKNEALELNKGYNLLQDGILNFAITLSQSPETHFKGLIRGGVYLILPFKEGC